MAGLGTDDALRLLQDVAAEVIEPRFRALTAGEISEKSPGDLVTVADHDAERMITAALLEAHPEAVVLGEEAYADDPSLMDRFLTAEHAFTVDPVDGTKNFVHGSPDHAVMMSEVRRGEVVRGWIWQPEHALAYVAERGAGTYRNGVRLTRPPVGESPRGITSRRAWLGQQLGDLAPLELTWVCCGVDYPHVMEGDADFVLYARPQPWDHAPGSLMLAEVGGHVGTVDGSPYRPVPGTEVIIAAADHATYERVRALL